MRVLVLILFLTAIVLSCNKKDLKEIPPPQFNLQDSVFYIKNIWLADLNEFYIQYFINTKDVSISSYGLYVKIDSANAPVNKIVLGSGFQGTLDQLYVLNNLKPDVYYSIRLFAVKNSDTVFSSEKKQRTYHLAIYGTQEEFKFSRPGLNFIRTNLLDSSYPVSSRIWIGSTECQVVNESSSIILFETPDSLSYGYYPLKLQRKGLEARVDSVYVLFGKWLSIGEYPVLDNPNIPGQNYFLNHGTFSQNGRGYLFGGSYLQALFNSMGQAYSRPDYFLEYDYPSNSWTEIPYSVSTYFDDPLVVTVNNETYIVGGFIDTTNTNGSYLALTHVYKFNYSGRKWEKLGPLPWTNRNRALVFVCNGRIYVTLGVYFTPLSPDTPAIDLWEYDPASGQWNQKQNFPSFTRSYAGVFVIGEKAYIIGGLSQFNELNNELWEYNAASDSWNQITYSNGPPPIIRPGTCSYNGKGYIINPWYRLYSPSGGIYSIHLSWEFDPITNNMTQVLGAPGNVSGGVLLQMGNKFIFTGKEVSGNLSKEVNEFRAE
jgi:hypothetical protein